MRSRRPANEHVAEVARRRLELLSEELAGIRRDLPAVPQDGSGGTGERMTSAPESCRPPADPTVDLGAAPLPGRHARRSVGPCASIGGWVHDRLPPTLQGRVQLGSSHLTVIALLVAAALAVTAWWVVRADAGGTAVPGGAAVPGVAAASPTGSPSPLVPVAEPPPSAGTSAGTSASPSTGTSTASASPSVDQKLVVDVAGKVRSPGIVSLASGSRVVDAIEEAGGARRSVDLRALNLARLLVDGEQILVGVTPPAGVAPQAASSPVAGTPGAGASSPIPMVNLNTATQEQLETLPGVGPVTAQAIMQWRTENGAYTAVDELLEVSGIGDATLAKIAPFVTI